MRQKAFCQGGTEHNFAYNSSARKKCFERCCYIAIAVYFSTRLLLIVQGHPSIFLLNTPPEMVSNGVSV